MNSLFTYDIYNWESWGEVFHSIEAWQPIIKYIFKVENLPFTYVEYLTPGTNAVFKVGDYVIKIFAPKESGIDSTAEIETEIFAVNHAQKLGISVPTFIAYGVLEDKYLFFYMIMKFIKGREFTKAAPNFSYEEKIAFGKKLRDITDKMNIFCNPFNDVDVIYDKERHRRWDKYPEKFKEERLCYLKTHDFGENVFVHGDLCSDNILIADTGDIYIIDFADAVMAPIIYEQALVASELFNFDGAFLSGYFGHYDVNWLTDLCYDGLLIHDFGGDIVEQHVACPKEIRSLEVMNKKLFNIIEERNDNFCEKV